MPSERNGKKNQMVVLDVKRNKKKQIVVCFTDSQIVMSENAFSSFPFYKGRVVTYQEMKELGEFLANESLYNYGMNIASKGCYSVHEVKEKLLKKNPNELKVDEVVFSLVKNRMLDDQEFAKDYAEAMSNRLYGENLIKDKLIYEKRVSRPYVDCLRFPNEREHAAKAAQTKEKSYSSLPIRQKKIKLTAFLERRGFDKAVIEDVLSSIKENTKEVQKKLQNEAEKAKKRYSNKYEGYELRQKVYAFLMGKGYKSSDISEMLERIGL